MNRRVERILVDAAIAAALTAAVYLNAELISGVPSAAEAAGPSPECNDPVDP